MTQPDPLTRRDPVTPPGITLDDKYTKTDGVVLISGIQALVRIAIDQRRRDGLAGLNTAGYISGYRGSPLGSFDLELEKAKALVEAEDIVFQPGSNEDLAASAIWGTQQVALQPKFYNCMWQALNKHNGHDKQNVYHDLSLTSRCDIEPIKVHVTAVSDVTLECHFETRCW